MRTRSWIKLTLAPMLALFVAASCEQQPVEPQTEQAAVGPLFSSYGQVVEQVSGGWMALENPAPYPRSFSFTARRYDDGTVQGRWERFGYTHGAILCFTVDGNEARIGTIDDETPTGNPWGGTEGGFLVVDNGQGANDPPDQMTLQWIGFPPGFADSYCSGAEDDPGFLEGSGNIDIR